MSATTSRPPAPVDEVPFDEVPFDELPFDELWRQLVTAGLLGTDRRDPPLLPSGALADTVADALRPTPQGRLLAAVATAVVVRRCASVPLSPSPPLRRPAADDRPLLPTAAVERWRSIVSTWPVLEAEWLVVASSTGWRPAADVLIALLRRHRRSPNVFTAAVKWGGPLAAWLREQLPDLVPTAAERRPADAARHAADVAPRPPVPAELEPLMAGPAGPLAEALVDGLGAGHYRWSHRGVLLNTVARMNAGALGGVLDALIAGRQAIDDAVPGEAPLAIWEALIELGDVRRAMLTELSPAGRSSPGSAEVRP